MTRSFDRLVLPAIFVEDGMVPRSDDALERMVESMEAVGQLVPIIVVADDNVCSDGVTRQDVMKRRGLPFVKAARSRTSTRSGRWCPETRRTQVAIVRRLRSSR